MPREPREFRTLDKDLSRVTNAERAAMQSTRPLLRLGIALLFVTAATLTATGFFAGQPAIAIVAVGMAVAAYLALSIGANDVSNSLGPAVGSGAIGMTTGLFLVAGMEVLDWGSSSPDWPGDEFWHGLPAHLCLPGHPFD